MNRENLFEQNFGYRRSTFLDRREQILDSQVFQVCFLVIGIGFGGNDMIARAYWSVSELVALTGIPRIPLSRVVPPINHHMIAVYPPPHNKSISDGSSNFPYKTGRK